MDTNTRKIQFFALNKKAAIPKRHSSGAAGYDLKSVHSGSIPPHAIMSVKTGFYLEIPRDYAGVIFGRSGLAVRNGLQVKGSYATSGEEIIVNIENTTEETFAYEEGMRIAQIVFIKHEANAEFSFA